MSANSLLMVADSDHDANMLYAVGMFLPDPFIYLEHDGKRHIVMSDSEIDRARAQARHCRVLSFTVFQERLIRNGRKNPRLKDIIALILKQKKIRKIEVPEAFPLGLAKDLKEHGIKIKPRPEPVFPSRERKTADEIKKISAALLMAEVGLSEGIHALRNSKVGKRKELMLRGSPLTAERLRSVINTAILQAGGAPTHTTVACGLQTCNPHETGYGLLFADQPILLEVSPRSQKTGYFGDLTRTVVKGRAKDGLRAVYHAVASAQEVAIAGASDGASAKSVHKAVTRYFDEAGYKTNRQNGRLQGFFHPIGNGIGLEIHESPRLSVTSRDELLSGHVVTISPGLYYSDLGGVRLKDLVHVRRDDSLNLTKFEKSLEV